MRTLFPLIGLILCLGATCQMEGGGGGGGGTATKILNDATLETLSFVSADHVTFAFSHGTSQLDALKPGGIPSLQEATPEIRVILARLKKVDKLMPRARQIAADAVATSIQQAGQKAGIPAIESTRFTRVGGAEGIGRLNEAIGAAFSLPIGVVSAPIKTHDAIFIERVNQRVVADSLAWEKQKEVQRSQVTNSLRQQRVQEFLKNLRENAKIEDKRKEVELANRAITQ